MTARAGVGRGWSRTLSSFVVRADLLLLALLVASGSVSASQAGGVGKGKGPAKRVLVLDSFGRDFSPYNTVASTFRTRLAERSPFPVQFLEFSLEAEALEAGGDEPIVQYVQAVFGKRPPDLVVSVGGPATRVVQRNYEALFPGIPGILGGQEERLVKGEALPPAVTAVSIRLDLAGILRNILELLPATRRVFVVVGSTPVERFWRAELDREWKPFQDRVEVVFLDGPSFESLCREAERLPPDSAIFFALLLRDGTGVPYEQHSALERLHLRANAPIFGWSDEVLGRGAVGGPLMPVEEVGREMAAMGVRLLGGESASGIPPRTIVAGHGLFDARELERWHVDEARLPAGSEVRFRPTPFLVAYRWQVLGGAAVIGAQALAIAGLLVSRRRRQRAEAEAARLRDELTHRERVTLMGQLASSVAHELNQPLGAILRNAEAGELLLAADPPDLAELKAILGDIRKDDRRASDVIERLRTLLRRDRREATLVEIPSLVDEVAGLIRADARSRQVRVEVEVDSDLPSVRADRVHLEQVLLHLLVNGMEAMEAVPEGNRLLRLEARRADADRIEITVSDSGSGIPPGDLERVFEPFSTTKATGLGMGLAISRSLVEADGGRIRAEAGEAGGTTFRVFLPSVRVGA